MGRMKRSFTLSLGKRANRSQVAPSQGLDADALPLPTAECPPLARQGGEVWLRVQCWGTARWLCGEGLRRAGRVFPWHGCCSAEPAQPSCSLEKQHLEQGRKAMTGLRNSGNPAQQFLSGMPRHERVCAHECPSVPALAEMGCKCWAPGAHPVPAALPLGCQGPPRRILPA